MIKTNFKGIENVLVVKNNKLIEGQMKFSTNEYKFITFVTGQINRESEYFDTIEIKVNDLKEHCFKLKKTTKAMYSYIKKYAYSMAKKNVTIPKEGNDIIIYNWFDKVETDRGIIKVCFSSSMKEFLLGNRGGFTQYKLSNILNLDTFYQMRLYEILKQYEKIGYRELSLKDLKFMLGIDERKIKRFADFKEHVLNKSIKKINEKTDMKVAYSFTKTTSEVILKFGIVGQTSIYKSKELNELKEKIENTVNREVHLGTLEKTIKKYNIKKDSIELYLENWDKFNYLPKKNPVAVFLYAVATKMPIPEEQEGIYNNKPEQSTNFEQREYDDEFFKNCYDNFQLEFLEENKKA